ncbi:MAG: HlyD family efflux transporter periplasmic adaptor subunit [Eubacteriales bacterium]|nr:HlyD family efflux transporter periplasmic adaptor subunit [Eubacteriales bacterium]
MKPSKWIPKIVMVAFFVGAILYFVGYAVQTFRNDITTVTVYETGVEDSVDTTGLVVRQETLLEGSGERMEVLPAEGEAVAKGEIIARIYQDQAALEQHQNLKAKQTEREALQYVLSHSTESSDTAELSKRVIASLESIRATVFHEDLSDLSDQIQSVENMIYRQDYTYKGSEAVTKEINQLEKEADSTVSTIKAKQAGTFSAMVDGYETVLEPAKLSGLTPAKLDELVKARQEVKEGKYLGKIITGGKWYYAVSMDVANVERMHEGMTVTVRFDNVAGEQTMKVETIGDAKGDQKQVTVVFSSTRHLAETSLLRQQSAAVIYESYRGFRVPKEALRMEGDKYYLYRVSGAQLRKVEVEILCQLDDYYVVWQGKSVDKDGKSVQQSALEKAKQIRDGDTIVVRGMNLYDGKVVGSRAKT